MHLADEMDDSGYTYGIANGAVCREETYFGWGHVHSTIHAASISSIDGVGCKTFRQ